MSSNLLLDLLYVGCLSFSWIWMMWCVDVCWWRWLKWMWFDFSLKLSTQSVRLNSSLRSFISFSEMKKKLQSLHWERKRSRRSRWWRRSWRRWTDTSQLFQHNQRHGGDDESQWRLLSKGLISDHPLIDWLMIDWVLDDKWCVCSAGVSSHDGKVSDLLVSLVSLLLKVKSLQFWSWMFFQSPDLTAGSTDAFWSFDSCATILGQPALQSLEEDAGHRPKQWVWRRSVLLHIHWKWCMREYLQISALCVNNQMSYYTKMSRKQEKNNFAPHDIYSYSDTADLSSVWLIIKSKIFTVTTLTVIRGKYQ